jgi:hypothetical protein
MIPLNSYYFRGVTILFFTGSLLLGNLLLGQEQPQMDALQVDPLEFVAGSVQTIRFEYTVDDKGINPGGGIRFELPVAYGETEPYFFSKPQTRNREFLGYVTASTSEGDSMKLRAYGISGGIFECIVIDKLLVKEDKILIKYTGVAQSLARKVEVRYAIRRYREGEWKRIDKTPLFNILPQNAYTMVLTSPADVVMGEPFELSIVLLDKFGNRAHGYRGTVALISTDPNQIDHPSYYTFTGKDAGKHVFKHIKYSTPGFQKFTAKDTSRSLQISTHYTWVAENEPAFRRYFGDTHFHTGTGANHAGFFAPPDDVNVNTIELKEFQKYNAGGDHRANFTNARDAYHYARDVVCLDFASSSEHDGILFDDHAWQQSQFITSEFYEPGSFTTFYAYEWTPPFFHHIVLYKDAGRSVFHRQDYESLPALWQALENQGAPAITIPHVSWQFENHNIWDDVNNTYRRLGEIYSLWNNRFLVQPDDIPQRFELDVDQKWSYQYAWDKGHKLGVIGSTDNHLGHPGANNYTIYTHHTGGFAAVLA